MISLEPLKTFVEAAAVGSFRRAASERFVTISAVSQQIKTLEAQLGVRLFDRLGRRVRLTPEGRALAASLRPAFAQIADALSELERDVREVRGRVSVGAPRAFAEHWVRPRLFSLLAAHPELAVQMSFDVPSVLERRLADGRLDAAILTRSSRLSIVDSRAVAEETFVAVAAPALVRVRGKPRSEADFRALPFAIYDPELAMHAPWWRAHFGESGAMPDHVVAEVPSLTELAALTVAGHCVCVLPTYVVGTELRDEHLVVVEPPAKRGRRVKVTSSLHLAFRRNEAPTARARALREALSR